MEDQEQDTNQPNLRSETERNEPVRSRWTPKPEQILILESIFSSGMVNPPKEETVRIRKLLQKFGSVGDANVFYWFQNRRSRSRRRQRQIQASLASEQAQTGSSCSDTIQYQSSSSAGFFLPAVTFPLSTAISSLVGSSSTCGIAPQNDCANDLYSFPGPICHPEIEQNSSATSIVCSSEISNSHYQSGLITVFINGIATEVPRGPVDAKSMLGQDFALFHSSGVPIAVNEYGFLLESLQNGESYFLVPRPT